MHDYTLVLNAGSSSLKFCVFQRADTGEWRLDCRGQIEGIGASPRYTARDAESRTLLDERLDGEVSDHATALDALAVRLRSMYRGAHVLGVGHRVVHGGAKYVSPTIVTPQVLEDLRRLADRKSTRLNSSHRQ